MRDRDRVYLWACECGLTLCARPHERLECCVQAGIAKDCLCPEVKVGGTPTGSRNWNPDCPIHPWGEHPQADRAVEWQRKAAEARKQAREGR